MEGGGGGGSRGEQRRIGYSKGVAADDEHLTVPRKYRPHLAKTTLTGVLPIPLDMSLFHGKGASPVTVGGPSVND